MLRKAARACIRTTKYRGDSSWTLDLFDTSATHRDKKLRGLVFFSCRIVTKESKQPIRSLRSAIMPMEAHWPICPRSQEKVGRVACGQRLLATSDTQENKLFNTFPELVNPCIRDSCNLCEFVQSTELAIRFISYITLHRKKRK